MINLSGLLQLAKLCPAYSQMLAAVPEGRGTLRLPVVEGAKSWLLAALQRDLACPMLVLTAREKRAREMAEELSAWLGSCGDVAFLPEPDAFFYEAIQSDLNTRRARLHALGLATRASEHPVVIVASVRSFLELVVDPAELRASLIEIKRGQRLTIEELLGRLVRLGYRRELLVEEPGLFAHRGGIVDLFPLAADQPVRLDFFGDEVETIRLFDVLTQRSNSELDSLVVGPGAEIWPDARPAGREVAAALDIDCLRPDVQERWAKEVASLTQADSPEVELLGTCFATATLLDYLPAGGLLIFDEPERLLSAAQELTQQARQLRDQLVDRCELPPNFPLPYRDYDGLVAAADRKCARIELSWLFNLDEADTEPVASQRDDSAVTRAVARVWEVPQVYGGRLKSVLDDCTAACRTKATVVIVSQQAARLSELCRDRDLHVPAVSNVDRYPLEGSLTIVQGSMTAGFGLKLADGKALVLTDHEVFGWSKPTRVVRRRTVAREAFVADLIPGDFAVHVEHGVGRFGGLVKMSKDGVEREYLLLEYADGDRLFVPTDHADRVNRYIGVGDHTPILNRLGGTDWARAKARVKLAAKLVAKELLDINAARELAKGHAFSQDTPWQQELETSFPYVETVDQLQAIADVKADMERPKPMDRLICGDVGYGKTEVALRAAFKAVIDAQQVAILVPTTVLAQQHYNTFRERMQAFPLRLEMLSRFRSDKEQHSVLDGLKAGAVDICIGTHRLLQKDVAFQNLGLVIIDEEQRFGVMHKERLKKLRREVDVLTLSATPIPRTLHMALVGLRDISTMETPPEERLPIKTYVAQYDDRLVREAIVRELERGGQVYFVHNRVQTIYYTARRLAELVPEASMAVGHGQLPEDQLEKVMIDFSAGKHDVLVCSTIIESGLDIPNVNTIIVDQADRLGLAQMYQLRGRVGRGANRAYAYFMFAHGKQLTGTAEKRLRTIFEATELGAGFHIAMKDLEIRGAGNLLGAEQHGHVAAVGFDLYCRLLADAVSELQGKVEEPERDVRFDLPLTAHLPTDYVADDSLRLKLYQRMAAIKTEDELGNIAVEMRDRFGAMPRPAVNLIYLIQMKLLALRSSVVEVAMNGSEIALRVAQPERMHRTKLQRIFGGRLAVGHTMLRLRYEGGESWMGELEKLLTALLPATEQVTADRAI